MAAPATRTRTAPASATPGARGPAKRPATAAASTTWRGRTTAVSMARCAARRIWTRKGTVRSHGHVRPQSRQSLCPDARDLVELVDGTEAAVLLPVGEDLLRGRGADAVQRAQLVRRRRVEVDRHR